MLKYEYFCKKISIIFFQRLYTMYRCDNLKKESWMQVCLWNVIHVYARTYCTYSHTYIHIYMIYSLQFSCLFIELYFIILYWYIFMFKSVRWFIQYIKWALLAYFAVCRLIRNSSKDTLYNQPFIKRWCLSLVDPKNGQPESQPFKSMIKCVTDSGTLRPPDFRLESFPWSQYQTLCQIRTCFLYWRFLGLVCEDQAANQRGARAFA